MLASDAAISSGSGSSREGRGGDDGAKMAARVRVPLPLRGQENIQGTNESETQRRISFESLAEIAHFLDHVAAA